MEGNTSFITKIISIFWEPSKTFKALSNKVSALDIIIPLIILSIVSWAVIPVVTPIAIETQVKKVEQSEKFTDEQKQNIIEKMEDQKNPITGYIFAPIGVAIGTAIVALVFIFLGNFMLGGERKFLEIWSVVLYGSLVDLVATAVRVPLILQKGTINIYTSLAIFMNESATFLFRFVKHLDIFSLWKVILFSIGLSVLYKKKLSNVTIIIFVVWMIYCLSAAALSGFSPF